MALANGVESSRQELLEAQAHVWNHIFNFINSMTLKCAIQLGIPEIIHEHEKPITLSELADALSINKAKIDGLYRLMRVLIHSKFFNKVKVNAEDAETEAYAPTRASHLLLRNDPMSLVPLTLAMLNPVLVDPWHHVSEWFHNDDVTSFATKHGRPFWEHMAVDAEMGPLFNEAMACDTGLIASILVKEYGQVFEGLESVVDVGGGTGSTAKIVTDEFPELKYVVLDLPHVVDGLEGSENLSYVGGDMFESIPSADAVFLKWILHDWSDDECIKILTNCKKALKSGGKLIVVDMVVEEDEKEEEAKAKETKLFFDMEMLAMITGKERTENGWSNLFFAAAFTKYSITPGLGLRSVIEVFP